MTQGSNIFVTGEPKGEKEGHRKKKLKKIWPKLLPIDGNYKPIDQRNAAKLECEQHDENYTSVHYNQIT